MTPRFEHHDAAAIPEIVRDGARLRKLAGSAYGKSSPVGVASPTLYVDAQLDAGASLAVPDEHAERAFYVAHGATCAATGAASARARWSCCGKAAAVTVAAEGATRGSARSAARRSTASATSIGTSSPVVRERIEAAKEAWRAGSFPRCPATKTSSSRCRADMLGSLRQGGDRMRILAVALP